ncbi:MAG: CAP domain-containing protein [Deltaproteobacteria bacterium]
MTRVALILAVAACGQMYRKPGDPAPPATQPEPAQHQFEPSGPPSGPQVGPQVGPIEPPPKGQGGPGPDDPGVAMGGGASGAKTIAQRFVAAHNAVRAKHCAAPLRWSPKLAAVAQKWADTLRDKGCAFGHSGGQYGENLAAGTEGVLDPEATVKMWYDEIAKYRFPDGGFSMETGHLTQVIWRGTTQVGCGHSQCKGNDIWVCNYDPAGNWDGQYRENVLPTNCKKS